MELTLETFVDGAWEHAATLDLVGDAHRSPAELSYEQAYLYKHDPLFTGEVIDRRALSVRLPLTLFWDRLATWPPFVLDFLPQGHARQVIAKSLDIDPDSDSADGPLLLRTGGSPIGNIRVREAWERERIRNVDYRPQGLSLNQVFVAGGWLFRIGGRARRRGLGIKRSPGRLAEAAAYPRHPMASGIQTPWWLTTTRETT